MKWLNVGKPDTERPLSEPGKRKMRKAVRGIKKILPRLDIIALSPSPVPEGYLSAAKAFGASEIFMKPFDVANLLDAVRRLRR